MNCTHTTPTIGLSPTGPWYEIMKTFSNNRSFLIGDTLLEYVVKSDTCDTFEGKTISLPKSSTVTFTILYNETFWKCTRNFNTSSIGNFRRILGCRNYSIYHSNNNSEDGSRFTSCNAFLYPKFLMVELSDKCSHCVSEGGYCRETKPDKFQCINNRKERRRFRLLLGLGISEESLSFGLLFWYRKKIKLRSLELASGNNSKQTMRMKTNLEGSKVYFTVPVFSYSELEEATKNFDPSNELGDGGFGTVYYGKLKDRREVAVKRLYERNCRQIELYMNEIEILACLRHQNLVTLYGCTSRRSRELLLVKEVFKDSSFVYLVFQFGTREFSLICSAVEN